MLAREKNIVWNVKTESGILRILRILFTDRLPVSVRDATGNLPAEIAAFGSAHAAVNHVGVERAFGDEVFEIAAGCGTADSDQFGHVLGAAARGVSLVFKDGAYLGQGQSVDSFG